MIWVCLLDDLNQLCVYRIYVFVWGDHMGYQKSMLIKCIFCRSGGGMQHWATRYVNISKDLNYLYRLEGKTSRSQRPRGLRRNLLAFAGWDCGFESRRGHGCLSLLNVVYCQVEVPATGRFLVQRSPTEGALCMCVRAWVCVCVCHWVWSGATVILYTYTK